MVKNVITNTIIESIQITMSNVLKNILIKNQVTTMLKQWFARGMMSTTTWEIDTCNSVLLMLVCLNYVFFYGHWWILSINREVSVLLELFLNVVSKRGWNVLKCCPLSLSTVYFRYFSNMESKLWQSLHHKSRSSKLKTLQIFKILFWYI